MVTSIAGGLMACGGMPGLKDDSSEFDEVHGGIQKFALFLREFDIDSDLLHVPGAGDWKASPCRRTLLGLIEKAHSHMHMFYTSDLMRWHSSKASRLMGKTLDLVIVEAVQATSLDKINLESVVNVVSQNINGALDKIWEPQFATREAGNMGTSVRDSWRLAANSVLLSDKNFKRLELMECGAATLHSGVDESEHSVAITSPESLLLLASFMKVVDVMLAAQKHSGGKTRGVDYPKVLQELADFTSGDWQTVEMAFKDFCEMVDLAINGSVF